MAFANSNMFALLRDDDDFSAPPAAAADVKKTKEAEKPKAVEKPAIKSDAPRSQSAMGGKAQDGGKGGKGGKGNRGYDRPPRDEVEDNGADTYGVRPGGKGGGKGKGGKGGDRGKGGYRGGEGGDERPRKREFDRRSGGGKGSSNDVKRGGSGKANWGSEADEINAANNSDGAEEKAEPVELTPEEEAAAAEAAAEKEREEKEMTLEEYQKVFAEKRSALTNTFNKNAGDRQVTTEAFSKMHLVAKGEEEDFWVAPPKAPKATKGKKTADTDAGGNEVLTNFKVASKEDFAPREGGKGGKGNRRREGGGKSGGAKGERGLGGGKGGRGYTAPNIGDSSAFPTLGA